MMRIPAAVAARQIGSAREAFMYGCGVFVQVVELAIALARMAMAEAGIG